VAEVDWRGELENFLRERFALFFARMGQRVPFGGLRIGPPLGVEEAKYFLLGLEDRLFELDDASCVQSQLFSREHAETETEKYRLFRHDPPPFRFFRERVCHLSTASLLILKRGWLRNRVTLDSTAVGYRTMADRADILIRSPAGALLVCVAVKRNMSELQKLASDLRNCCTRGLHAQEECGFPQNHPRYEFCLKYRPAYVWGVAPDANVCLKLGYEEHSITVEVLPALPQRSLFELE
jgi:hypothetical protein